MSFDIVLYGIAGLGILFTVIVIGNWMINQSMLYFFVGMVIMAIIGVSLFSMWASQ